MSKRALFCLPLFAIFLLCLFVSASYASDCVEAGRLSEDSGRFLNSFPSQALEKLEQAVKLCEESASLRYNLGVVLYLNGREREAAASFENAIRMRPGYAKAMNDLAYIHATADWGSPDRALEFAMKAVSMEPSNQTYRDTLETAKAAVAAYVNTPPVTSMSRPYAVAVVIGNRNYQHRDVPKVDYAHSDARAIQDYLVNTMGFREGNIIYREDATFAEFREIFGTEYSHKGKLYNYIRPGKSEVFVYYSGHGTYDVNSPNGNKTVYFVPVDASPNAIAISGYPLNLFYENLQKIKQETGAKDISVVIDSCFSGGSEGGMLTKGSLMYIEVENPLLMMEDTAVFTSATGNQISSWYPERQHSMFTYFFLKAIKDKVLEGDKTVSFSDIEPYVKEEVGYFSRRLNDGRTQTPVLTGDREVLLLTN